MRVFIDGMYSFARIRNNKDLRSLGAYVTKASLKDWGLKTDQVWALTNPLSIRIKDNKLDIKFKFRKPYLTDLASVPKRLRGIIDNDDIRLIAPALVHDFNFATHFMTFRESNRLFRKMIVALGGSGFKAFFAWLAVASPFGRYFYKQKNKHKRDFALSTCDIIIVK